MAKKKPAAAATTAPAADPPKPAAKPKAQPIVSAVPGRCPKCDSTRRSKYVDVRTWHYPGTDDGKKYTHIVWRRTSCLACGQKRIDRCLENRK